jgi:hypothetical protein
VSEKLVFKTFFQSFLSKMQLHMRRYAAGVTACVLALGAALAGRPGVVGLYKLNSVYPYGLKAPGFKTI